MDLHGIGPSGAARLLVEVRDITCFPTRAHFASWNGTAPIDASSGDQIRHRLSRAGNRQINRVLHIMATVQVRNPTEGRAYFDRRTAAGKNEVPRSAHRHVAPSVLVEIPHRHGRAELLPRHRAAPRRISRHRRVVGVHISRLTSGRRRHGSRLHPDQNHSSRQERRSQGGENTQVTRPNRRNRAPKRHAASI